MSADFFYVLDVVIAGDRKNRESEDDLEHRKRNPEPEITNQDCHLFERRAAEYTPLQCITASINTARRSRLSRGQAAASFGLCSAYPMTTLDSTKRLTKAANIISDSFRFLMVISFSIGVVSMSRS